MSDVDTSLPSLSSQDSIGGYTTQKHCEMDRDVANNLELLGIQGCTSFLELLSVLLSVVEFDDRLDKKYLDVPRARELLMSNPLLQSQLVEAWQTGSYRAIRRLDILRVLAPASMSESQMNALRKALTSIYRGCAVEAFHEYLTQNNRAFAEGASTKMQKYYGKFCSIVQSSGTGKTRLMLELHKKDVCVLYMNIRSPKDNQGYPNRDNTPADMLTHPCATENEYRSQCYAFFAAIFKVLRTSLEKEEAHWYENMCEPLSAVRHLFFEDLDRECDNVNKEILASSTGRTIMKKYYEELVNSSCFPHAKDNEPRVVIALDEAHVLHDEHPFSRANVFLRTIKEYSEDNNHAVWVVFASTTSKVAYFSSPQALSRVAVKGQLLFPPFTRLGWDQNAPALGEIQPYDVANAGRIIRYGRPLWVSLKEGDDSLGGLLHLAEQKLCGSVEFQTHNHHQAFAVLAQRFGLDIAFGHRNAVGYVETSVASHLRACIKTTEDRIWSYTLYPSEPILSCAAASLLHGGNPPPAKSNLVPSLEILERMVNDGVIDIGQIGELVSRFIWLLAKDFFIREKVVRKDVGWGFDQELEDCQLVSVVEFLQFVFGPTIWNVKPEARELFQNAYINFSHWISMDSDIRRHERLGELPLEQWTLCHWERTSAVQCCHDQPLIDKVLPMYFKPENPENPGKRAVMSQILISDKARRSDKDSKRDLNKIKRDHASIAPNYRAPHLPYITILADLAVEDKSGVKVSLDSSKDKDTCLRILASGLNATTYPFLKGRVELTRILSDLFKRQIPPSTSGRLQDLEDQMLFGRTSEPRHMNMRRHE